MIKEIQQNRDKLPNKEITRKLEH